MANSDPAAEAQPHILLQPPDGVYELITARPRFAQGASLALANPSTEVADQDVVIHIPESRIRQDGPAALRAHQMTPKEREWAIVRLKDRVTSINRLRRRTKQRLGLVAEQQDDLKNRLASSLELIEAHTDVLKRAMTRMQLQPRTAGRVERRVRVASRNWQRRARVDRVETSTEGPLFAHSPCVTKNPTDGASSSWTTARDQPSPGYAHTPLSALSEIEARRRKSELRWLADRLNAFLGPAKAKPTEPSFCGDGGDDDDDDDDGKGYAHTPFDALVLRDIEERREIEARWARLCAYWTEPKPTEPPFCGDDGDDDDDDDDGQGAYHDQEPGPLLAPPPLPSLQAPPVLTFDAAEQTQPEAEDELIRTASPRRDDHAPDEPTPDIRERPRPPPEPPPTPHTEHRPHSTLALQAAGQGTQNGPVCTRRPRSGNASLRYATHSRQRRNRQTTKERAGASIQPIPTPAASDKPE